MVDPARYERLVAEHKDAVYRQMIRTCGDYDDAEDVLVEALMKAYRALDQLQDDDYFRAWLATIGRRICGRLRKKEALAPVVALSEVAEPAVTQEELDLSLPSVKAQLKAAVEGLPEAYRQVYLLRDIEEVSGEETAERLGISLAAMKSRLHRARGMMREALDHCVECREL